LIHIIGIQLLILVDNCTPNLGDSCLDINLGTCLGVYT
jgi:hypothetical protein